MIDIPCVSNALARYFMTTKSGRRGRIWKSGKPRFLPNFRRSSFFGGIFFWFFFRKKNAADILYSELLRLFVIFQFSRFSHFLDGTSVDFCRFWIARNSTSHFANYFSFWIFSFHRMIEKLAKKSRVGRFSNLATSSDFCWKLMISNAFENTGFIHCNGALGISTIYI